MESARASAYAGDPVAGEAGKDFANVMGTRALQLRVALARHDALQADDMMSAAGKARLIEENARLPPRPTRLRRSPTCEPGASFTSTRISVERRPLGPGRISR
jgi:hypothetical protein